MRCQTTTQSNQSPTFLMCVFVWKSQFWQQLTSFYQRSQFWLKATVLSKSHNFDKKSKFKLKLAILTQNQNFDKKSKLVHNQHFGRVDNQKKYLCLLLSASVFASRCRISDRLTGDRWDRWGLDGSDETNLATVSSSYCPPQACPSN